MGYVAKKNDDICLFFYPLFIHEIPSFYDPKNLGGMLIFGLLCMFRGMESLADDSSGEGEGERSRGELELTEEDGAKARLVDDG